MIHGPTERQLDALAAWWKTGGSNIKAAAVMDVAPQIDQVMDESRGRTMQREKLDAGVYEVGEKAAPAHRPLDGMHREDCPQCRRNAA